MALMNIGDIVIRPVLDGYLTFPAEPDYPQPGSPDYEAHKDSLQPDGRRRMTLGGFLVQLPSDPDRLILVDAGNGPSAGEVIHPPHCDCPDHAPAPIRNFYETYNMSEEARQGHLNWLSQTETQHGFLLQNLERMGIKPEQITDVVFSHLHFDHIGWASIDGRPAFPNATIRVHQKDLEHFLKPDQAVDDAMYEAAWGVVPTARKLEPVLNRIETWDGDVTLAPGFDTMSTPGHTPGHSVFVLSSGEKRGMLLGDAVHCPLQLTDSDFSVMADMDQALADKQRERIYREISGEKPIDVAASHFPDLRFGRVLPGKGRSGWTFVN